MRCIVAQRELAFLGAFQLVAIVSLLLSLLVTVPVQAQETTSATPRCGGCTIGAELVVTIGGPDGTGLPGLSPPRVTRFGSGWLVAESDELGHYDARGQFQRFVGSKGQGPGEWRDITKLASRGDSVAVFDAGNGRVTILGPDLELVRDFPLPAMVADAVALQDGFAITGSYPAGREHAGHSLFILDAYGSVESALDAFDYAPRRAALRGLKWVTRLGGDRVVTVAANSYTIRLFATDGEPLKTVNFAAPPWWKRSFLDADFGEFTPEQQPPSAIVGVARQGALLWVVAMAPAEQWRRAFGERIEGEAGADLWEIDRGELYRSVVELVDLRGVPRVHARGYVDGAPLFAAVQDGGFLATLRTDDVGLAFIDVWKLTHRHSARALRSQSAAPP